MLKILSHDLKVQALHVSHGVVTILFHCHPRELVIDQQAKINHMLIFMMSMFLLFLNRRYQSISLSAYVVCIYNSFWWIGMVSLVVIAGVIGDFINIDFMHLHGPRKTFN